MSTNERGLKFITTGLLLGIFMVMMDVTILDTVMGAIIVDIKGIDKIAWVSSAYLCMSMAGMPIFGKLADMYGRKKFYTYGLTIFIIGSFLCSTAASMTELSIYRAIQGIGGGSLVPIALAIILEVYPPERRAMVGATLGMVFGLADVIAPLLGAYITAYLSWHWVFYINIPIGLLSFIMITFCYKESSVSAKHKLDWSGAITLVGAVVSLMLVLGLGGSKYSWSSVVIVSLFITFLVFLVVFVYIENRAKEPIIPYQLFKDKLFTISNVAKFFYGATFVMAMVYAPIFVQGVLGRSVIDAGLTMLPMTITMIISGQVGSFFMSKTNFRTIMVVSGLLFLIGTYLLSTVAPTTTFSLIIFSMALMGAGAGASFTVLGIAAIHNLNSNQYGSANSIVSFSSTLGMTMGISIFGIIQRNVFLQRLNDPSMVEDLQLFAVDPNAIMRPETRGYIPEQILQKIAEALSVSIADAFMWATVSAALALLCGLLMGKERLEDIKK